MKMIKHALSMKTKKIRHILVRLIAPTLYSVHYSQKEQISRPMTSFMRKHFTGKPLVGVEIGVARGDNAKNILETLPVQKLYLVDPYMLYLEDEILIMTYKDYFSTAKKKLLKFKGKVKFILKYSLEAIDSIPDNLDFVYIDGNHNYEFVKKDIELYYPKVRRSGVIGGHDFTAKFNGLCRAVNEFINENKLKKYTKNADWWIVKT